MSDNAPEAVAVANSAAVNREQIEQFVNALFQDYDWDPGECVALRGIGEKGTPSADKFSEERWIEVGAGGEIERIVAVVDHWNKRGLGGFLVPGIVRAGTKERARFRKKSGATTEADVGAFTSICLDLDNPETANQALSALEAAIGRASMVVESSPGKLHVYWLFDEAETDVAAVARVRQILALKAGGDASFGKVPQVIRIAGGVHGKFGIRNNVKLLRCDPSCRYSFGELAELVGAMFPLPWRAATADLALARLTATVGGGIKFTPLSSAHGGESTVGDTLTTQVFAGGEGEATRWARIGEVIGHHIHLVRIGRATAEDARRDAAGYNLCNVVPPFPEERFAKEWSRMWSRDIADKGPMPALGETLTPVGGLSEPTTDDASAEKIANDPAWKADRGLMVWAAHRWASKKAPQRRWLVGGATPGAGGIVTNGLVRVGASHVMAAEGGVGKTFALLDLAMKVAAPRPGDTWMGVALNPAHVKDGRTAIILTAEDDKDELHIRMAAMDPDGSRLRAAGDRLLVIPLLQADGAFPLVEVVGGVARTSSPWSWFLEQFKALKDSLGFVAIDTLAATLHGEENAALVLQQYITALNKVQGVAPDCATMVTHHIRKQGARDAPIQSAADMRNAIRGSNALLGAVRMVIGMWQPHDWSERLTALGRTPKPNSIFNLAVVKGNNPEVLQGEKTLGRHASGGLEDITDAKPPTQSELAAAQAARERQEWEAWIVAGVERAAAAYDPFMKTGDRGIARGRADWFPQGRLPGNKEREIIINELVAGGRLVRCSLTASKSGSTAGFLDVPRGVMVMELISGTYNLAQIETPLDWAGWDYNKITGVVEEVK